MIGVAARAGNRLEILVRDTCWKNKRIIVIRIYEETLLHIEERVILYIILNNSCIKIIFLIFETMLEYKLENKNSWTIVILRLKMYK